MSLFDRLLKKQQKSPSTMKENEYLQSKLHERKVADIELEDIDGVTLLNQHENGFIDDKVFIHLFGKVKVFYSTPFGDHIDGGSRLFVLPAQDKTAYLPVFSSIERAMEFYNKAGRRGFLILEGSFTSFLETIKGINVGNMPIKMGAVIDPGDYGVTIDADMLDDVIDMTK